METKNDITELRSILFDTLRGLKEKSIDIDQAKAINDTAQTIINSAKVEVDHAKVTGKTSSSGFLPEEKPAEQRSGYVHRIGERSNTSF